MIRPSGSHHDRPQGLYPDSVVHRGREVEREFGGGVMSEAGLWFCSRREPCHVRRRSESARVTRTTTGLRIQSQRIVTMAEPLLREIRPAAQQACGHAGCEPPGASEAPLSSEAGTSTVSVHVLA
jgi:hypothetical protein